MLMCTKKLELVLKQSWQKDNSKSKIAALLAKTYEERDPLRRLKNFKCNDCKWQSVLILTIEKKRPANIAEAIMSPSKKPKKE